MSPIRAEELQNKDREPSLYETDQLLVSTLSTEFLVKWITPEDRLQAEFELKHIICSAKQAGRRRHPSAVKAGPVKGYKYKTPKKTRPLADRFWAKVHKSEGCWLWIGSLTYSGYGHLQRGRAGEGWINAHRASWELHFGPIPKDVLVLHACDNRRCVRPDHLFLGSPRDNTADMYAKGRAAIGVKHGNAVLTPETVKWIRNTPWPIIRMARHLGLNRTTVRDALRKKTWKHVG